MGIIMHNNLQDTCITPIANRISYPLITALCQGFTVGKIDSVNQLVRIEKAITRINWLLSINKGNNT